MFSTVKRAYKNLSISKLGLEGCHKNGANWNLGYSGS